MIEILHRYTSAVLYSSATAQTMAEAVSEARKSQADLSGANLSVADLSGADLSRAYLGGANLSRAYLGGANLSRADLGGAYLSGANLSRAYLGGANLSRANLSGANLSRAYLGGANLSRANLSRAYLSGANLSRANLSGADLSGADLSGANLDRATGLLDNGTVPLQIQGTRHPLIVRTSGIIQIGCEAHPVAWWMEHYKALGRREDYTAEQVREYRCHIALARAWMKIHKALNEKPKEQAVSV